MVIRSIPCVLMRGGTSKGIFFRRKDLPPKGPKRDCVIMRIFGSGSPSQIDGLGGSRNHTSKTMIVWKSNRSGVDVDYTFGQVGIEKAIIDYNGNCGNLTSAIAPFAVDENIVATKEPYATVRMYNTNTDKRIDAKVPIEGNSVNYEGDYWIESIPYPGARIDTKWYDPGGAFTGKLLPTGNSTDIIDTGMERVEVSIVDASNPAVFVRAKDIPLTGRELPNGIAGDSELKLERIRSKAAEILGFVKDAKEAKERSSHFPYIIIIEKSQDYKTVEGRTVKKDEYDILARLFSLQEMHHGYAVSGAICTGAAAKIPESVVNDVYERSGDRILIGHPRGVMSISVETASSKEGVKLKSATVTRTARRLMAGLAYYPI